MKKYDSYIVKKGIEYYPYEIKVYDPRSDEVAPSWFTDILKLEKFEGDTPVYSKSVGLDGMITYQVPSSGGHISVPIDSIIAYNVGSNEVFVIKTQVFKLLYSKRLSLCEKILKIFKHV